MTEHRLSTPADWQVSQNCSRSASEAVADKSLKHRSTLWDQVSDTQSCPVTGTNRTVSASQRWTVATAVVNFYAIKNPVVVDLHHWKMKPKKQSRQHASMEPCKKANKMLGMIKRTVVHKDPRILVSLYKSLVRPHLEYCCSAWAPHYQSLIASSRIILLWIFKQNE